MTGADAVLSVPEDLVELGGGRLAVRVWGRNPRVVPIRAEYTSLAREAAQAAEGAKFVQGDNDNAAALIAAKIAGRPRPAHKVTHLSLRRARQHLAGRSLEGEHAVAGAACDRGAGAGVQAQRADGACR